MPAHRLGVVAGRMPVRRRAGIVLPPMAVDGGFGGEHGAAARESGQRRVRSAARQPGRSENCLRVRRKGPGRVACQRQTPTAPPPGRPAPARSRQAGGSGGFARGCHQGPVGIGGADRAGKVQTIGDIALDLPSGAVKLGAESHRDLGQLAGQGRPDDARIGDAGQDLGRRAPGRGPRCRASKAV